MDKSRHSVLNLCEIRGTWQQWLWRLLSCEMWCYINIVTCQPFVGWHNGVARHRPVNKASAQTRWCHATALEYGSCATVPRSRDDVTCVYMVARRRAAILWDCKGSERRDVTVLLNNAMTVAGRLLTQLGYVSEAISRFSSVPGVTVKQSVFEKQLHERVVK
jgi:hypothetical protein